MTVPVVIGAVGAAVVGAVLIARRRPRVQWDARSTRELDRVSSAARAMADYVHAYAAARGIRVTVAHQGGRRTEGEQAALVAAGRSRASGATAPHVRGDAVDFAFLDSAGKYTVPPAEDPRWTVIGAAARAYGARWGGDWAWRDMPHVEVSHG